MLADLPAVLVLNPKDNVGVVLDSLPLSAAERERHLSAALDFTGLASLRRERAAGVTA